MTCVNTYKVVQQKSEKFKMKMFIEIRMDFHRLRDIHKFNISKYCCFTTFYDCNFGTLLLDKVLLIANLQAYKVISIADAEGKKMPHFHQWKIFTRI